jgi:hypothetical protein
MKDFGLSMSPAKSKIKRRSKGLHSPLKASLLMYVPITLVKASKNYDEHVSSPR